jgi:hypothetical protein
MYIFCIFRKLIANFGQSIHLACSVGRSEAVQDNSIEWHHYSKNKVGRGQMRSRIIYMRPLVPVRLKNLDATPTIHFEINIIVTSTGTVSPAGYRLI